MKKALPLGVMEYEELITNNYYAVDKTMMIQEFLESQRKVTLITRPRRFGKTLNMSMLSNFFDITKDSSSSFKDTKIMLTKYVSEMNQYPTIFISFAGAKKNLVSIIKHIKLQIRNVYDNYEDVFTNMTKFAENEYENIVQNLMNLEDGNINGIDNSIVFLMQQLEEYYHQKVMLFIDEYDTPFIEAHVNGFYEEIKGGLASMLHNALKLSSSLQYACITGIQRVAKENIFSDLNNLVVCTVKDKEYSSYFGFNEEETSNLLEYYGLELNEDVKSMYDGYRIGNVDIYNPWSIINYASRKELESYWINTSSNTMIKNAMQRCDDSFKEDFETLIQTGVLETTVIMETSFFEVAQPENLWGLLVNAGYLTIEHKVDNRRYVLRIPNQEVNDEFKSLTAFFLNSSNTVLDDMFYALLGQKSEVFLKKYRMVLLELPSYYDLKDENSYHMMLLGMCAWLRNRYEIISNRESGQGRCDIILKALHSDRPSFVFEFKYLKGEVNESEVSNKLKELANSAVCQIKEKQYDVSIKGEIIYIGLAHYGKQVEMCWK